jgi:hypothetical protein
VVRGVHGMHRQLTHSGGAPTHHTQSYGAGFRWWGGGGGTDRTGGGGGGGGM